MKKMNEAAFKNCVAAMDLGTNSNRLLIVDDKGKTVFRDVSHVALGEGLAATGRFCQTAISRAVTSFMVFADFLELYQVRNYRAIATAACRMSQNTEFFLAEVKKTSGIDVEVISEVEEARLTLKGASLNAPKDKKYLLVYDLGGGSTEVTLALNGETPEILETISIPLGARNATEIFNLREFNQNGVEALTAEVQRYMADFVAKINAYDYKENVALIATSSTPLRLVSWIKNMPSYDKFKADGVTVKVEELETLIERILPLSLEEKLKSVYIGRTRAEIIVAACVIFRTIYRAFGVATMTASLKSAQEAIVSELLAHKETA